MRDVFGVLFAALLDFKWLVLGLLVGGLLVGKCAQAAEKPDPEDFEPVLVLKGDTSFIIVQKGQFDCPTDNHRAVYISEHDWIKFGCASLNKKGMSITWEVGGPTFIPMNNYTDGPAKEQEPQPRKWNPPRNS